MAWCCYQSTNLRCAWYYPSPRDWPGKYIFAYDAIISLGSSLIFENIGSGVPCFIASFLGGAREGYYSSLSEFYLESADELRRALGNVHTYAIKERQNKVLCEFRCDGLVTEDIVQKIYNFCEHKHTNEMHSIKNVFWASLSKILANKSSELVKPKTNSLHND